MSFFNNDTANFIQHIAIVFEILGLFLVIRDLKHHKKDKKPSALAMGTGGFLTGIRDRSKGFYFGIALATLAIFMELYQLACIYFVE